MSEAQRFPYIEIDPSLGAASALPYVSLTLEFDAKVVSVPALVDSGAALSVLPYDVGIRLGAVWEQQMISVAFKINASRSGSFSTSNEPTKEARISSMAAVIRSARNACKVSFRQTT